MTSLIRRLAPAACLAALALAAGWTIAQPPQGGAGGKGPDAAAMKKMVAQMLAAKGGPAAEHKVLETFVGTFDMNISMPMGPGMPPMAAKAVAVGEWVLGGRFIQLHTRAADDEDLKIESISYLGFDKRSKKYFWWAIDSTDTYSVAAEGDFDPATKTLTLLGQNVEPEMGGKATFRTVFTLSSPDHRTMNIAYQANDDMKKMAPPGALDADGWFTIMASESVRKK